MAKKTSTKRIKIDKANATMVGVMAAAAFVVTFSLMASRALVSKSAYQGRLIKEKKVALRQLKANVQNVDALKKSYFAFASETENVLGGNPKGNGPHDGDNAKIVLDALPSVYDYPALASSIEKILKDGGYALKGISGADDPSSVQAKTTTGPPQLVEMPFPLTVSGSYSSLQTMVVLLERSIRPVQIDRIVLDGTDSSMTLNVVAKTYYQPEKVLQVNMKVVK